MIVRLFIELSKCIMRMAKNDSVVDKLRTIVDTVVGVYVYFKLVCEMKRNFNSRTKIGNQVF